MMGGNDNDSPFLGLALSDGGYAFSGQFYTGVGYYYGYNAWMVKTDSTGRLSLT
jgi:hypothetical protein